MKTYSESRVYYEILSACALAVTGILGTGEPIRRKATVKVEP